MESLSLSTFIEERWLQPAPALGASFAKESPVLGASTASALMTYNVCAVVLGSVNDLISRAKEGSIQQDPQFMGKVEEILSRILKTADKPQEMWTVFGQPQAERGRVVPEGRVAAAGARSGTPVEKRIPESNLLMNLTTPRASIAVPLQESNQLPLAFVVPYVPSSKSETFPTRFKRKKDPREEVLEERELLEGDEDEKESSEDSQ